MLGAALRQQGKSLAFPALAGPCRTDGRVWMAAGPQTGQMAQFLF